MEPERVASLNRLAGRAHSIRFKIDGKTWWLKLLPDSGVSKAKPQAVAITWKGASAVVSLPAVLPENWLAPGARGLDLIGLPSIVRIPAVTAALEPVHRTLVQALGDCDITPLETSPSATDTSISLGWAAGPEGEPPAVDGYLMLDPACQETLATLLGGAAFDPQPEWLGIHVPIWLEAGSVSFPLRDLAGISLSDVALLDEAAPITLAGENLKVVVANRLWFSAKVERNQATARSPLRPLVNDRMPHSKPSDPIDELPIRLSFTVGETGLSLAELRQIQPGHVIALDHPADQAVRIRANGQIIGTGELMQVGDQVGVRFTEFRSPS
jgi:type III secretion protein Q